MLYNSYITLIVTLPPHTHTHTSRPFRQLLKLIKIIVPGVLTPEVTTSTHSHTALIKHWLSSILLYKLCHCFKTLLYLPFPLSLSDWLSSVSGCIVSVENSRRCVDDTEWDIHWSVSYLATPLTLTHTRCIYPYRSIIGRSWTNFSANLLKFIYAMPLVSSSHLHMHRFSIVILFNKNLKIFQHSIKN